MRARIEEERRVEERIRALADGSRIFGLLSRLVNAPGEAARSSAIAGLIVGPVRRLDLHDRVRLAGAVLVVAVLTHSALLLGLEVSALAWTCRAAVVTGGMAAFVRPGVLVAAWQDRAMRRIAGNRA
jgi:hypothetical protein